MKKILFVAMHRPDRSPSQRFRFEQYLKFLSENGYICDFSYLIDEQEDKVLYKSGNYLGKLKIFIKSGLTRFRNALQADKYSIIFIQREAFMIGTTLFERMFARSNAKVIFDFDDSIWIQNISEGNKLLGWLKNANKTKDIIRISDMVFAGNEYLADYARQFNDQVKIVPTTIDTDEYKRIPKNNGQRVCIGWSGSFSTIQHFEHALPALRKILAKYPDQVYIKVIGDGNYYQQELQIKGIAWKKETEIAELSEIDIGIMPLPNDEWANGKCGLKGLQYMALEIATIMSPVGVNSEIILDGENGFLASGVNEWVEKISLLIENKEFRQRIGRNGRQTIEEKYSVDVNKEVYLQYFNELLRNQE